MKLVFLFLSIWIVSACASKSKPSETSQLAEVKSSSTFAPADQAYVPAADVRSGINYVSEDRDMPSISSMLWRTFSYPVVLLLLASAAGFIIGISLRNRKSLG